MFAYENGSDVLLIIVGGETSSGYTKKNLYYSMKERRYCDPKDHPNYNNKVDYYENGKKVYRYTDKDEPYEVELKDEEGNIVYKDGQPIMITKHTDSVVVQATAARAYIEDLQEPMAGIVAFSYKTTTGLTRYYIGLGKTEKGVNNNFYEYNRNYDMIDYQHQDANYSQLTWESQGSIATRGNGIGLYQPVLEVCGSIILVGTGETADGVTDKFYSLSVDVTGQISSSEFSKPSDPKYPNEIFKPRANAASFYLNYTADGITYNRFYIGTGRTGKENGSYDLLNDFWCYDFNTKQWNILRECSNIKREGAVGFPIERNDDEFTKDQGVNARGIFSFGYGYNITEGNSTSNYLNDNWEYLP